MNNYLIKASLGVTILIFNFSHGMSGPLTPPSNKPLISVKFKKPNTFNSGAAVKKGGIGISRTEEDEIWSLFAGFRNVCSLTSKTLGELKLIMKKYGEIYPNKRCHVIKCTNNSDHEYLMFSDEGSAFVFLEEKRIRRELFEDNVFWTGILLGYEAQDIKYFYKRSCKMYPDCLFDYESDKAESQEYIQENLDTIQEWAHDNITISYTWPGNK